LLLKIFISDNFKIYFNYLLSKSSFFFIKYNTQSKKHVSIAIPYSSLYFLTLHLRLSTVTYSTQLVDIFSYELPLTYSLKQKQEKKFLNKSSQSSLLIIYNFHNLLIHTRYVLFTLNFYQKLNFLNLKSIAELFPNANWLEREVSELYGFSFENKKDTRNLMLQYGDTSAPFQKFLPSIGLKEMFYDSINDLICQTRVTTQI
jgi:NADH:ubiquinone oxidoreductase subunit C